MAWPPWSREGAKEPSHVVGLKCTRFSSGSKTFCPLVSLNPMVPAAAPQPQGSRAVRGLCCTLWPPRRASSASCSNLPPPPQEAPSSPACIP